ncbi:PulJ/GspJ family protein [Catenuloplanes nepalensis]|nr:hypothetical protein [Catenuloplanes nepalensis]
MRRLRARRSRGDAGITMAEVMVSMTVMAVLMVIFTGAIIQIHGVVNKADTFAETQLQLNNAFIRLDKEVRYARAISEPAQVNGDWYVEYVIVQDTVDTCVELRMQTSTRMLQRRQWQQDQGSPAPTRWTTIANGVGSATPFTVTDADSTAVNGFGYQRLTLDMTAVQGGGSGSNGARAGSTRQSNITFTALNATATNVEETCIEARGIPS